MNKDGETPLYVAASNFNYRLMATLLLLEITDVNLMTPRKNSYHKFIRRLNDNKVQLAYDITVLYLDKNLDTGVKDEYGDKAKDVIRNKFGCNKNFFGCQNGNKLYDLITSRD